MDRFWDWFFSLPAPLQRAALGSLFGAMMIGSVAQSFLGLTIGAAAGVVAALLIQFQMAWKQRRRAADTPLELPDWHPVRASAPENRRLVSHLLTFPWIGAPAGYILCLFILEDPEEALIGFSPGFVAGLAVMMVVWKLRGLEDPLPDDTSNEGQDPPDRNNARSPSA